MSAAAAIAHISLNGHTSGMSVRSDVRTAGTARNLDADSQLVARCLSGAEGAGEELVKTHTRRVYSTCLRFLGRENEAQDLTQDVFLRVFKTLGSFRAGE